MKLLRLNYFDPQKYQFHMVQVNIAQNEEKTKQENLPGEPSHKK